jgi:hypothetical protein
MPVDLQELRNRIVNAIALADVTFLNKLWDELQYRLDVCRITRRGHAEHLYKPEVLCNKLPNVVVEWLTLLFPIREVPGSFLSQGDLVSRLRVFVIFLSPSRLVPG